MVSDAHHPSTTTVSEPSPFGLHECPVLFRGQSWPLQHATQHSTQYDPLFRYNALISYNQPTVYYYITEWEEIPDQDGGVTEGGEYVVIVGNDFGTVSENAITSVTYGPNGVEYEACTGTSSKDYSTYAPTPNPAYDLMFSMYGEGAGYNWWYVG